MSGESTEDLLFVLRGLEGIDAPQTFPMGLEDALEVLREELPGFWWRGGTCHLSSEAIIAPDHNCPVHGERLRREFPPTVEHWNAGVEVELRPGSEDALARALLAAICRVKLLHRGVEVGTLADANSNQDLTP